MPPLPRNKPTKKSPVRGTSLETAISNQQPAISCGSQNFMLHGGSEKRENRNARLRKRLDQRKKEERGQASPRSFLKRQKNQRCKAPGRLCCPLGNITGLGASPFILVCSAGETPGVTANSRFFSAQFSRRWGRRWWCTWPRASSVGFSSSAISRSVIFRSVSCRSCPASCM